MMINCYGFYEDMNTFCKEFFLGVLRQEKIIIGGDLNIVLY